MDDSFDPKLRAAMSEIKGICRKYDIGGTVTLHSGAGHSEYALLFDLPSWSQVQFLKKGGINLRWRGKSDPAGANATTNMIVHGFDVAIIVAELCARLKERIETLGKIEDTGGCGLTQHDGEE